MAEKVVFQQEVSGYSTAQVDAYVELLLDSYEELLSYYQHQQAEIQHLSGELEVTKNQLLTHPQKDYTAEALELLNETTQVIINARVQTRNKITTLVDQFALHAHRLEESMMDMKGEVDKMYVFVDEQL
jgi:cell division septum initiation protein DivIVA